MNDVVDHVAEKDNSDMLAYEITQLSGGTFMITKEKNDLRKPYELMFMDESVDVEIDTDLFYVNLIACLFQLHPRSAVQAFPYPHLTAMVLKEKGKTRESYVLLLLLM